MTEWNASEYDRLSALQAAMAEEVLSLLKLEGSERILDVGCGNGKTTAPLPRGSHRAPSPASMPPPRWSPSRRITGPPPIPTFSSRSPMPAISLSSSEFDLDRLVQRAALDPGSGIALQGIHHAIKPEAELRLRLVSKGARKASKTSSRKPPLAPLGRLLQRFPGSLSSTSRPAIRGTSRAAGLPRPQLSAQRTKPGTSSPAPASWRSAGSPWSSGPSTCRRPSVPPSSQMCSTATGASRRGAR